MKSLLRACLLLLAPVMAMAADAAAAGAIRCDSDPLYHCVAGAGRTTLLFIHGWGGRANFWDNQLNHFSGSYRTIAIELPGHEHSISYRAEPTIDGMAKALNLFMETKRLDNVILVGHDMGAVVGLAAAANAGARVRTLVALESLVDTHVEIPEKQYRQLRKRMDRNFAATARQLTVDLFSETTDAQVVEQVADAVATTDPAFALPLLDDFFRADLRADLSNFRGQVVILNTHYNPPRLDRLRALSPGIVSIDVPWEEHLAFLERPALFNRKLEQVLRQLPEPGR